MWVLNVFLYLLWAMNSPLYVPMVQAGSPCYSAWTNPNPGPGFGKLPTTPQPSCFYDPGNTNVFVGAQLTASAVE